MAVRRGRRIMGDFQELLPHQMVARILGRYGIAVAPTDIAIIASATAVPVLLGIPGLYAIIAVMISIMCLSARREFVGPNGRALWFFLFNAVSLLLFRDIRGIADAMPWVGATQYQTWNLERYLFGGTLPNARLQRWFFDPTQVRLFDVAMTAVYASFFFVSIVVGIIVARRNWPLAWRFVVAKSIVLVVGLVIIFALPSNPPWLTPDSALDPSAIPIARVYRVTAMVLGQKDNFAIEADTNPIAAMPSIHMATTFLVLLIAWSGGRIWRVVGATYVVLMGLALLYLGEHYLLDSIAGALLAMGSWQVAQLWDRQWSASLRRRTGALATAVIPRVRGTAARQTGQSGSTNLG